MWLLGGLWIVTLAILLLVMRRYHQVQAFAVAAARTAEQHRKALAIHEARVRHKTAQEERLQRELQHSHKMESLGALAGGIAHDFNNILTAIISNAQLLLMKGTHTEEDVRDLSEIVNNGVRAAGLTRQLLTFSRKRLAGTHVVSVYMTVTEMLPMLRRLIREDVKIELHAAPDTGMVWTDQSQVEQLIMNLAVNARDAMPNGGTLSIATRSRLLGWHPDLAAGSYVEIVIEDTGKGMTEELTKRVFESGFTTKESSGIGLATVARIVQQAHGHVFVESRPGIGSKFTIWLPELVEEMPIVPPIAVPPRGHGVVLLVEDEPTVRSMLHRGLQQWGYEVRVAGNGREALKELEQAPVNIVVTDVIMPEMGGRELGQVVLAKYPGIGVLYMTGYTHEELTIETGRSGFIQKPFDFKTLVLHIQTVLEHV